MTTQRTEQQNREILLNIAQALEALENKRKYNAYEFYFTEKGPTAKSKYPKHIEFMNAGGKFAERLFSAGNQTGKTSTILWEAVTHATLNYPDWWEGRRFRGPTVIIIGAKSWDMVRDGIQTKLLGDVEEGTGIIPKSKIVKKVSASGTPGCWSQIWVKNKANSISKLMFKTYDSGVDAWKSMTVDGCFFDEEPPLDIYREGSIRTLQRKGVTALGFTPDNGLTATVMRFFKDGDLLQGATTDKFVTFVGWDDVPHLDKKRKAEMLEIIPEYLREAKCKGIPYLGVGRIFPFDLDTYIIDSFQLQPHYERCFGMDLGVKNTAAVWIARDPDTQVCYAFNEYLCQDQIPQIHAENIKLHGNWIPGVGDPYLGKSRNTSDLRSLIEIYQSLGLDIELAERNTKASGIEAMKVAFISGRLKIFKSCQKLINQLNLYHRTDDGNTGNTPDDLVDALRYAITYGLPRAMSPADYDDIKYSDTKASQYEINRKTDQVTGY